MIFADAGRLIVYGQGPRQVVGVISLSDPARFSFGSCKARNSARPFFAGT